MKWFIAPNENASAVWSAQKDADAAMTGTGSIRLAEGCVGPTTPKSIDPRLLC